MILATQLGSSPASLLEKILADADLDYLGRGDYFEISEKLYREFLATGKMTDRKNWLNMQISFMENHTYHTSYALKYRRPIKRQHLESLQNMIAGNSVKESSKLTLA